MKRNTKYTNILTKDFLIKEYLENKKSSIKIAKEVECTKPTILNYLKNYKIKIRTNSEALKLLIGEKTSNYKGKFAIRNKLYYCKDCGIKITYQTAIYGKGRCRVCASKYKWEDEKYREKQIKAMFKGMDLSPNKPEKLILNLLNKILPKQYKFVGNGKLIVGGFCPDFVNKDNNKIIEMFGDYWHNKRKWNKRDEYKLKIYKKLGFKILIIWQHELKYLDKVKDKILKFSKN